MVIELEHGLHWAQLGLSETPTSLSVPDHCPMLQSWLRRGEDLFSPPSLVGYLSITFLEVFSLPGLNTTPPPLVCFHRPLPYIPSSTIPGHPFWRSSSSCLFYATEFGGEIGSLYLMLSLSLLNLSSFPGVWPPSAGQVHVWLKLTSCISCCSILSHSLKRLPRQSVFLQKDMSQYPSTLWRTMNTIA